MNAFDDVQGLKTNHDTSLVVDLNRCYIYLSLPRHLRHPDQDLYYTAVRGNECIQVTASTRLSDATGIKLVESKYFGYTMDLAQAISANADVDLTWRPYESNNWLASVIGHLGAELRSFVPVVGPLLSLGFTVAWEAISNPEAFEAENVMGFSPAVLGAIIGSAKAYREQGMVADGFYEIASTRNPASALPAGSVSAESGHYNPRITEALKVRVAGLGLHPSPIFRNRMPPQEPQAIAEAGEYRVVVLNTLTKETGGKTGG